MYEKWVVGTKDVYIVESHHHVLLPWSIIRRQCSIAPYLITLDHHTDTVTAFRHYVFSEVGEDLEAFHIRRRQLLEALDWTNDTSVIHAIDRLRNDEHIHAATMRDIIDYAFVIQSDHSSGASFPNKRIVEVAQNLCVADCEKTVHDEECEMIRLRQLLEPCYLDDQLSRITQAAAQLGVNIHDRSYVLDIDLDYFHAIRTLEPDDPSVFHHLIRNASAITIALEPYYVESLKVPGEAIDSAYILQKVLAHIQAAQHAAAPDNGLSRG